MPTDEELSSNVPDPSAVISGHCDPNFAEVRDAFARNFAEHDEIGASVAVSVDGRQVVDLWAGSSDAAGSTPWGRDTIVDVFSVGKVMATLALLVLVDDGRVDLDAPVSRYWPEFAARGKDTVTVRTVLAHRAGVPGIRHELPAGAMYNWALMTSALADEEPWWDPGTRHGYHVNTFGFLVGQIVRRASEEDFGAFFARTVAGRAGADFHFGLRRDEDRRTAEFVFPQQGSVAGPADDAERLSVLWSVYQNPPGVSGIGTVNTRAWRAAQHPSSNGHANARAICRVYSFLAAGGELDGVRLVTRDTLADATTEASYGEDAILQRSSRFGLGFQLTQAERPLGPNPGAFGHFGAGGSLGFADPEARLAFGYAMNRFGARWQDPRNQALLAAVYRCV